MDNQDHKTGFNGTSLLVVDDEPRQIAGVSEILKRSGFRVEGAMGGKEALSKLSTKHYDLLLLDLLMPEVDGFEVLNHLSSHGFNLTVVACSGTASPQDAARAIQLGAFDFVAKPEWH